MQNATDEDFDDITAAFEYLDSLRASGATNMFGAGAYLERDLGLDRKGAREMLSHWMTTFDGETSAAERAAKANASMADAR